MTTFAALGLNKTLQANIKRLGYKEPTAIQEESIGAVLSGTDTYAIAPTGTGKTAAYLLPILQELSQKDYSAEQVRPIRAIFLVPTRELAQQVHESINDYGKDLGLRTISVFGGVRIESQINRFKRGSDIIVATPKRLVDLRKAISLDDVEHFVMDEADRLVSMGVVQELRTILEVIPKKAQKVVFSATDSNALAKFCNEKQKNVKVVKTKDISPALDKIVHTMYRGIRENKTKNLFRLLGMLDTDHALIFAQTKSEVNRLTEALNSKGLSAAGLHNEIPQKKRQEYLAGFKNREFKYLVATDLVSRGIDIEDLYYVINFDLPVNCNDYVHRAGRTARKENSRLRSKKVIAEKESQREHTEQVAANTRNSYYNAPQTIVDDVRGHVFSLVCPEQERLVALITKAIGKDIKLERMPW